RTRHESDEVRHAAPPPQHTNIRAAGIDFKAGEKLVQRGTRLNARHVALIAAAGIGSVSVTRRPRIAVLATGNELVPPGTPAAAHQIFDSVSFALLAMLEEWGGEPRRAAVLPDEAGSIAAATQQALEDADLVVIIGGASVGDYDLVKPALARLGLSIAVPRIAIRPGKPPLFATLRGT